MVKHLYATCMLYCNHLFFFLILKRLKIVICAKIILPFWAFIVQKPSVDQACAHFERSTVQYFIIMQEDS